MSVTVALAYNPSSKEAETGGSTGPTFIREPQSMRGLVSKDMGSLPKNDIRGCLEPPHMFTHIHEFISMHECAHGLTCIKKLKYIVW